MTMAELTTIPKPHTHHHHHYSISLHLHHLLRRNPNLSLHQLKQIHAQLFRHSLHHNPILLSHLISSSSSPSFSTKLFTHFPAHLRDLPLLNCLLKSYLFHSQPNLALSFYVHHFLLSSFPFSPDHFTFPYLLKAAAAAALSDASVGRQIHATLTKTSLPNDNDTILHNSLVDMYFKCGDSDSAMKAFRAIQTPNSTSWNMMMSGLLNSSGGLEKARVLFDGMKEGVKDVVSWNTLLSAYAKAGEMGTAREVFNKMPVKNLVSWNALIAGYCQNGECSEALRVFARMIDSGVEPDSCTLVSVASAFTSNGCTDDFDNNMINRIVEFAKSINSMAASTSLLCLYAKAGKTDEARQVFDKMPDKDLVTWNAMISCYSQNFRSNEAIQLFQAMQQQSSVTLRGGSRRVKPDGFTMVSLLDSCSQLGALELGQWIHAYIKKNKIELDVFLITALVDMYAKCGDLNRSRILFLEMPDKDVAAWNAMINGLAIHGKGKEALLLFDEMRRRRRDAEDMEIVNSRTFVSLLSACSHSGLISKGLELFESMPSQYGITPQIGHYGCVVDLLGRAGRLNEAYEFIKSMPIDPDAVVWVALLGACRFHRNIELAEEAAHQLAKLNPRHDGNYVLLSNVYATVGKWQDVAKVRARMKATHIQKELGWSAVEMGGQVHEFTAGDRSHTKSEEIYKAWDEMVKRLKAMGYEPDTSVLVRDLEEMEDKEEALYRHSEKLALSFALIGLPSKSAPIRIIKNLRICSDCHRVMELVSIIEEREIVVRDRSRFHCFSGGSCSCGGYW